MKTISSRSKKSRAVKRPARAVAAAAEELANPTPDPDISQAEAVERSRKLIINAAPDITQGVIGQARLGSYLHARMLFDFAGLTAAQAPESASVSPVLELLMQELEKPKSKPALA